MSEIKYTNNMLLCIVHNAIQKLFLQDFDLIDNETQERSIAHKLAIYIEEQLIDFYDVDIEYNREGSDPKRIPEILKKEIDDIKKGLLITPDILVHKRKKSYANLLIIEIKTKNINDSNDKRKLEALTCLSKNSIYRYQLGLHIKILKQKESDLFRINIVAYINGVPMQKISFNTNSAYVISEYKIK